MAENSILFSILLAMTEVLTLLRATIHPTVLYTAYPTGSWWNLESIPADSGHTARYIPDRMPVYRGTHTHSHSMDTLEMSISLRRMSFDWGGNLRTQRKPTDTLTLILEDTVIGFNYYTLAIQEFLDSIKKSWSYSVHHFLR